MGGIRPFLDMFLTFWSSFAKQAATQAISNPACCGFRMFSVRYLDVLHMYSLYPGRHIISILWTHINSTGVGSVNIRDPSNARSTSHTVTSVQELWNKCVLHAAPCVEKNCFPCQLRWCNRWLFPTKELHHCHEAGYHWQKELPSGNLTVCYWK